MKTEITIKLEVEHDARFPNWDIQEDRTLVEAVAEFVQMHLRASTMQPCTVEYLPAFAGQSYADDPASDLETIYVDVKQTVY